MGQVLSFSSAVMKAKSNPCRCPDDGCLPSCYKAKPSYSAAQTSSPYTGIWDPPLVSGHEAYKDEREPVSAKVLDIYRNHGPAQGIVELMVEHMVAKWMISPQPNLKALDGWDEDDKTEFVENIVCWYRDVMLGTNWIDSQERMNFRDMAEMVARMRKLKGEITGVSKLYNLKINKHRELSTAVQLVNPARIRSPFEVQHTKLPNSQRVIDGIHLDRNDRCMSAYIFHEMPNECDFRYLSADKKQYAKVNKYGSNGLEHREVFLHFYKYKEEDAFRGVSDFASTVGPMWMQHKLNEEILAAQISQNKRVGVITSDRLTDQEASKKLGLNTGHVQFQANPDGTYRCGEYSLIPNVHQMIKSGCSKEHLDHKLAELRHQKNKTVQALDGAQYLKLSSTERLELLQHNNQQVAANELMRSIDHMNAPAHGLSTNMLNRDFTEGSYTSQRAGQNFYDAYIASERGPVVKFSNTVIALAMEEHIEKGILKLPRKVVGRFNLSTPERRHNYFLNNRRALAACNWRGPAKRMIDARFDVKGLQQKVDANVATQDEIIEETTGDAATAFYEAKFESDKRQCESELKKEIYMEKIRREAVAKGDLPEQNEEDETNEE